MSRAFTHPNWPVLLACRTTWGFDLWSIWPNEKRCIEVKGRTGTGEVEISANEWAKACNLRDQYWLYIVYDCASPNPHLVRILDPFDALLAKAKGSAVTSARQLMEAAQGAR